MVATDVDTGRAEALTDFTDRADLITSLQWDSWSNSFGVNPPAPSIAALNCPSNVSETPDAPTLAYVGNAGWAFTDNGTYGRDSPIDKTEHGANGIFFDNNKNKNLSGGTADGREDRSEDSDVACAGGRRDDEDPDAVGKPPYDVLGLRTDDNRPPVTFRTMRARSRTPSIFSALFGRIIRRVNERINGDKNYDKPLQVRRPTWPLMPTRRITRRMAIRRAIIRAA